MKLLVVSLFLASLAAVFVLVTGSLYTIAYVDSNPKRDDAHPIVPIFTALLYGTGLFAVYSIYKSRKLKHPYNYCLLFMGGITYFVIYFALEFLYRLMYGVR
jgi:hypothetical protein